MSSYLSENTSQGARVAVVGAGIGGLTAAFRLQQQGLQVEVFEAEEQVGGRMATRRVGEYQVDLAASIFPDTYTRMLPLIEDAGLMADIQSTSNLVGILREGRIHRTRSHSKIDGLKTGLLSAKSKLVLLRALFDASRAKHALNWYDLGLAASLDVESAADYARRRLNDEVLNYVVDPACRAVCLNSPEQVSAVDFLFALRNILGGRFFNSPSGADFLPRGLARQLDIHLATRIESVEAFGQDVELVVSDQFGSRNKRFDACVIALPAPQMLAVNKSLAAPQRHAAQQIRYTRALGVHLGFVAPAPGEPAVLIQIPQSSHPHLSAVLLEHNKAPRRAPANRSLLTTIWQHHWAVDNWEAADQRIVEKAMVALRSTLPSLAGELEVSHVQRWEHGPVMTRVGSYQQLAALSSADTHHDRIQLVGDYFSSTSTHASLCAGERAAQRLKALLR